MGHGLLVIRNLLTLVPEGEGGLWSGGELIHHHFPRFSFTRCQKSCPPQREETRGWERRLLFCPHISSASAWAVYAAEVGLLSLH